MSFHNSSGTSFHVFHSSQSSQNFAAQFCTTPRSHLTPLKIFAEPLFSLFSTITLVESRRLHATQSQFHTRSWCPDTCRPLRFPSILVLCQEEATREPCLQPLRLLPIQLLMQMILLQLHAATFLSSATPDSAESMLEVASFSALSVFLALLSAYALQEPPLDQ